MILVALFVGVVLIVAAIRNSQGALFTALGTDVPGYVVWAAALVAVGAVGYAPGLKPVSRGLLALVLIVIILNNYSAILAGFQAVAVAGGGAGARSGPGAATAARSGAGAGANSNPWTANPLTGEGAGAILNGLGGMTGAAYSGASSPTVLEALLSGAADTSAGFGGMIAA